MNPQRDDELLRRYREASSELDERPAASTRAAILAAAAREIGARPVDAAKPTPRPRMRWPWAAAAAVMLSTLAVLLATRTEQEQASFTLPAEPVREAVREPAQAQPMAQAESVAPIAESKPATQAAEAGRSAAADSRSSADLVAPSATPVAPAPLRKENRQLAAAEEPPVARAKTEGTAADAADARDRAPMAPAPAASPPSSAPSTAEAAAAGTVGGLRAPAAEQQAPIEHSPSRSDSGVRPQAMAAKQKAEAADAANERERDSVEKRPEDWLQKIIRLRIDGRHDEAEAELKRFRERYPQWQVPPAALGPSGTR